MALSVISICNVALDRLGHSQLIADLAEGSLAAQACSLLYEPRRDFVLHDFPWPFANAYRTLALIEEDPNSDWDYSFRMPSDCITPLRIITGAGEADDSAAPIPFDLGSDDDGTGLLLWTDEPTVELKYTRRIVNPLLFDPGFASALSWSLAAELVSPLSMSESKREAMAAEYRTAIRQATTRAANKRVQQPAPEAPWYEGR